MTEFFEIAGTHIRYTDIKDFRIVQREYIYRPTYSESDQVTLKSLFGKKYRFSGMQPYAAILDESSHKSSLSEYQAKNMKESVTKDLIEGAMTTIGDKLNIKALRAKKFHCINQAGRRFTTYLEDIPTVLIRKDGKVSDVQKNDDLYPLLGEPIAPTIEIVDALLIKTSKESFLFYGAGIHVYDAQQAYQQLTIELDEYSSYKKEQRRIKLPKFSIRKLEVKKPTALLPERNSVAELTDRTQILTVPTEQEEV